MISDQLLGNGNTELVDRTGRDECILIYGLVQFSSVNHYNKYCACCKT